jgi:hypothetical protein
LQVEFIASRTQDHANKEEAEGAAVMGSPAAAAVIAQIAFWVLIVTGISYGWLSKKAAAIFVVFWLAGYIFLPRISYWTWPLVASWVAVLDIVLVFIVFKGDVRIT